MRGVTWSWLRAVVLIAALATGTGLAGCGSSATTAATDAGADAASGNDATAAVDTAGDDVTATTDATAADAGDSAGEVATPDDPTPAGTEVPNDDLSKVTLPEPTFAPDQNNLLVNPAIEPASAEQSDAVIVLPDRLEFPVSASEVLDWEVGREVVSAPGQGMGNNPMGFARRVLSVAKDDSKITVMTDPLSFEEIAEGDILQQLKPEAGKPMDLSKMTDDELKWVADNLYYHPTDPALPGIELLPDDEPAPGEDGPQWGFPSPSSIVKQAVAAVSSAPSAAKSIASSVAAQAKSAVQQVTNLTLKGSVDLSKDIEISPPKFTFFNSNFQKTIKTKSKKPIGIKLFVNATGSGEAYLKFNPGVQFGAVIKPLQAKATEFWLTVKAKQELRLALKMAIEAGIAGVDPDGDDVMDMALSAINTKIEQNVEFAKEVLTATKEAEEGSWDLKPAAGWSWNLFFSKPQVYTIAAGPVPVVFTTTFQVDLECGFQAKASIDTEVKIEQKASVDFEARWNRESNKWTITGPKYEKFFTKSVSVLGGGELTASCSLVPRVNVFVYDSIGMFVGVRGSVMAGAKFSSKCSPNSVWPTGQVGLKLAVGASVFAGARVQAPGSSLCGANCPTSLGLDVASLELWGDQWPLYENYWDVPKGLGYCTPTCKNGMKDSDEIDTDCGGPCTKACADGKSCTKNSDCVSKNCNGGKCGGSDTCSNGVRDGSETSIDCGGSKCKKCSAGQWCASAADCTTNLCKLIPGSSWGTCSTDHCATSYKDGDECGIDCGGAACGKCKLGAGCGAGSGCATGFSNGYTCVASACQNFAKDGQESDADCGGPSCAKCTKGKKCGGNSDCASGMCVAGVCDAVALAKCSAGSFNGGLNGATAPGFTLGKVFTFEAWVRLTAQPSSNANFASATMGGPGISLMTLPGNLTPVITATTPNSGNTADVAFGAAPLQLNSWSHVAGVYDGLKLYLYVNGALSGSATPNYLNAETALTTGGLIMGSGLTGQLDEVRISNIVRYSGSGSFTPAASLTADANTLALYKFSPETGAPTTVIDSASGKKNGTLGASGSFVGLCPGK